MEFQAGYYDGKNYLKGIGMGKFFHVLFVEMVYISTMI
jgi:hypothetical protein